MNKTFLKSAPVALAVLALASCSSDDFLGSKALSNKTQLLVEVEAPGAEEGGMRSAFSYTSAAESSTGVAVFGTVWESGDQFRAYDAALQAYDIFESNGTSIVKNDANPAVTGEYVKALFPSKRVFYAGYDKANGVPVAVMNIPAAVGTDATAGKAVVDAENNVAYVNELPMWGDVELKDGALKTTLSHLGAYAEFVIYNTADADAVRILAVKNENDFTDAVKNLDIASPVAGWTFFEGESELMKRFEYAVRTLETSTTTAANLHNNLDGNTPLAGYFEAKLEKDGILVANQNDLLKGQYTSYITVQIDKSRKEAHVFLPVVCATYNNLVFQVKEKLTGNTKVWKTKKILSNYEVKRNTPIRSGLTSGTAPKHVKVTALNLERLSELLEIGEGFEDGCVVDVELEEGCKLETTEEWYNLEMPQQSVTVNIDATITTGQGQLPLRIVGGKAGKEVTLNIKKGVSGAAGVAVNTNGPVVLCGEYNSSNTAGSTLNNKVQILTNQKVSLGDGLLPFSTNMTILLGSGNADNDRGNQPDANLVVNLGNGKIAAIEHTADTQAGSIQILSGEVGKIGAEVPAASAVTVKGGAKVGDLKTKTGAVTLETGADVKTITTTGKADVTITGAEVEKVTLDKNSSSQAVALNGGANGELAKIGELDANSGTKPVITSKGKAAILKVTNPKSNNVPIFKSSLTGKANSLKTDEIENGQLYTAAQLAGIGEGAYTNNLTEITLTGCEWTPVNLSGNFSMAQESTIKDLNAALFGKISGTAVVGTKDKKLILEATSAIAPNTDNQGLLAREVDGTVTINYVKATGSIEGKGAVKNYGGLVGKATGTVTLLDNQVITITTSGKIEAYANVGGYVGNFAGGTITIKVDNASSYVSNVVLSAIAPSTVIADFDAAEKADKNAGTFGYFIGTVSGEGATIKITKHNDTTGNVIEHYFTGMSSWTGLNFENNWYKDGDTKYVFKGMDAQLSADQIAYTHEIGYSNVTSIGAESVLYGVNRDKNDNKIPFDINVINVFEKE